MAIGRFYLNKKWDMFFLKYFFQLWEWKISSGGRAHGWKVLRGLVNYNKRYFFNFNYYYSVWNYTGIIQSFLKTLKMNFTAGLIFYPVMGLFSVNILDDLHDVCSFLKHNTTTINVNVRGNSLVLRNGNIGFVVFCVQTQFAKKSLIAWSAGCYAKILKKSEGKIFLQLPSLYIYTVSENSSATLGLSSKRFLRRMTKAGQAWHMFRVPKVWGIAMNPVDHPHGGWTNKGGHPVTPSGRLTRGIKTWWSGKWSWRKIFAPWLKSK